MTTLITIKLECPVCGIGFSSHRIGSTNTVGQDTDFRPHAVGIDPLPHYVHVCPRCLYAAYEGDYATAEEAVRTLVLSPEWDGPARESRS